MVELPISLNPSTIGGGSHVQQGEGGNYCPPNEKVLEDERILQDEEIETNQR